MQVKMRDFILPLAFAFGSAFSVTVIAAPSCTNWEKQSDGTYWQECVNDDGTVHCYQRDANGGTSEVQCR
jgi:hypothetical protein